VTTRVLLSWSSGKDSAWALQTLLATDGLEVVGLLCTLNETHDRVAMHAVRRTLLERQAAAVGLPLTLARIPSPCTNAQYEDAMRAVVQDAVAAGVQVMAFGDLYLEDIRAYREQKLAGTGLEPMFPLWGSDTQALAEEMQAGGLRAYLTCVDPKQVSAELAGRAWDAALLADLPPEADPCGENGEFHTFVWDGPMFREPVHVEPGERLEREGFVYCDLTLAEGG
jgi:uncharacterized protein (TIGR00290 family)